MVGSMGLLLFLASAGSYAAAAQLSEAHASDSAATAHSNGHGQDDAHSAAASTASSDADHSDGTAGTSGDPTEPQPVSNADENTGGANGQCPDGPYCSTRDGSASENGNGDGAATGKPCAGCVGKADNKNPQGQKPNATDANNGYECDGNKGIAKGNPAHTSCTTTPSEQPSVQPSTETEVEGEVTSKPPSAPKQETLGSRSPATLPFTGIPVEWTVVLALGLMIAGLGLRLTPARAGAHAGRGVPTLTRRGGRHLV